MTTEAGKRLLDWMVENVYHPGMSYGPDDMAADIAAIEAEACEVERARLAEAVRGLPVCVSTGDDLFDNLPLEDWNRDMFLMLDREAVLALLEDTDA